MLRFLSNYIFQNENEPEPNENPTTAVAPTPSGCPSAPKSETNEDSVSGRRRKSEDDLMEYDVKPEDDDDLDEEDDWVLIGGENKPPKEANEEDKQPVILVAPGDDEDESQSGCVVEEEGEEEEEAEDESKDECKEEGLFWENKLIEHPSMSVYIDLATSLNNGVTSCISLASIAPSATPGESVIVLEHVDDSSDDEGMDFVDTMELVPPQVQVVVATPKLVKSDKKSTTTSSNPPQVPVQNGKRKKGHYPCSSSNTGNMPRRHLRNSGGPKAFQAINSWGSSSPSGGSSPDHPSASSELPKRKARSQGNIGCSTSSSTNTTTTSSPPTQASACGIGMVGATPTLGHHSSNMLNKNMKLLELFPVGKEQSRKAPPPSKNFATSRGHFLQEGRRRSDMQNYTKHSHVNNDRRSAQQRRSVQNQKVAAAGGRGK